MFKIFQLLQQQYKTQTSKNQTHVSSLTFSTQLIDASPTSMHFIQSSKTNSKSQVFTTQLIKQGFQVFL